MSDDPEICLKCKKSIEGNGAINGICPQCQNGKNTAGRPEKQDQQSKTAIKKAAIESDGSPTKMAEILGVSPSTAHHHLQNPTVQKALQTAQEKSLEEARITRQHIYSRLKEGTDANLITTFEGFATKTDHPDYKERRESVKIALQLLGDLKKDGEVAPGGNIIMMPSIYIDNVELKFDVGEQIIDVDAEVTDAEETEQS